jgi:hypothetical protein
MYDSSVVDMDLLCDSVELNCDSADGMNVHVYIYIYVFIYDLHMCIMYVDTYACIYTNV